MTEEDQTTTPPVQGGNAAPPAGEAGLATEVSRRVSSILDAVEREASRLRDEARAEAGRYLEHSRRRADGLVAERQRRIAELSNELITKAEAVVARLDDAAPVRQGFEHLVRALGDAAERLSRESEEAGVEFEPPPFHGDLQAAPGPPIPPPPPVHEVAEPTVPPNPRQASPAPAYVPPIPHAGFPAATVPGAAAPQPPDPAVPHSPVGIDGAPAIHGADWRVLDDVRLIALQMAGGGNTRSQVREHLESAMGITDTRRILDEIYGAGSADGARVPWTSPPR